MNYPEWAPSVLVELHKLRIEKPVNTKSPEDIIELMRNNKIFDGLSEEDFEKIRRDQYANALFGLPDKEATKLLEKLITNLQMRAVWKSLGRRISNNKYYQRFWYQCEAGIAGWRGSKKLTPKERRDNLLDVEKYAMSLLRAMKNAQEFNDYSIMGLIDSKAVSWLLSVLDSGITPEEFEGYIDQTDSHLDYAAFSLREVVPNITLVLLDISRKALEYAKEEPQMKRPNSENAEVQYFVRHMSAYMKKDYGQPLHDVVALTASTIFEKEIDSDYVRKIVK